jgi:hypothetical protein
VAPAAIIFSVFMLAPQATWRGPYHGILLMVVYAAAGAILFGTSDCYAGYALNEIPWEENCPSGLPV